MSDIKAHEAESDAGGVSYLVDHDDGARVLFHSALTIGRHPENDLVLDDPAVSSRHVVIEHRDDGWCVIDLGSMNGTTLNGRRLRGSRGLKESDVLRIAGVSTWRIGHLASSPGHGELPPTERRGDELPDDLRIELRWTGPDRGSVAVWADGVSAEIAAQQPFVLLVTLALQAGAWVDDTDIKSALWGRAADRVSRGAFYNTLLTTRRMLQEHGIPACVIEKGDCMTRLALDAECVMIAGYTPPRAGGEE